MLKKNLQKIPLLKSTWRTLGNIRGWFTRSFKEKSTSSNHSQSPNRGNYIERLTSAQPIRQLAYGLLSMEMGTRSSITNITRQDKRLIITLESSTPRQARHIYNRLLAILQEHNGLANLHNAVSISPQPIKKSEQTSTRGSDSVLRRFLNNLK